MRVLLNFSVTKLEDILEKGNIWYVKHYCCLFDRYICAYVIGKRAEPIELDSVLLVPLGRGRRFFDLMMSPLRIFKLARKCNATDYLSADLAFAWWHSLLLRWLLGAKIVVMPVCVPPEIHKISGRTYSGMPCWLERLLIKMTFYSAAKVLCVSTDLSGISWVRSSCAAKKLSIVPVMPEEFASSEFIDIIDRLITQRTSLLSGSSPARLIYVGRLEREKLVNDLIDVSIALREMGCEFILRIVGDGLQRSLLEMRVSQAGLDDVVHFLGFRRSDEVAQLLIDSDIFVSPYTGTSFREAAYAGLAIVAYRIGYAADVLIDGQNCLMAEPGDSDGLAEHVASLIADPGKARSLGVAAKEMLGYLWTPNLLLKSLNEAFDGK